MTTTVVQFGARPGQRQVPSFVEDEALCRVCGEIKKLTTQPGKIEIVFSSEDVDAGTVSRIAELQQLGTVYIYFEQAPDLAEGAE